MELFRSAPKWVRSCPVPMHREALLKLAKDSKGQFDKPREMNHSFCNLTPGAELDELRRCLEDAGWVCSTEPQVNALDKLVLTAAQKEYRITEQNYTRDLKFFRQLEDQFHVEYEGWYASS